MLPQVDARIAENRSESINFEQNQVVLKCILIYLRSLHLTENYSKNTPNNMIC